jgi:hypothetical protein
LEKERILSVKKKNRFRQKIILTLILFSAITIMMLDSLHINRVLGTEYATMRIVNPLTGDGNFIFNVTEETDFTVLFYISNVSDMVAWQITISWNNSIIQYNQTKNPISWVFPHGHVFQQAEDEGHIVLKLYWFYEVETPDGRITQDPTAPGTGFLKAGATAIPFYPVDVSTGEALLCQINFTIVATPQPGQILQTNINLIKRLDPLRPSLDSFIVHPDLTETEINAEPAVVRLAAGPVITATVDIKPQALNLGNKLEWITAYIELPEGFDVANINVSTLMLNNTIPVEPEPITIGDYDNDTIPDLMVKFNRTVVCEFILSKGIKFGNVKLKLSGKLYDGTVFKGSNVICIRMPGDPNIDGKVDMTDITIAVQAFGSYPGHPRWNPITDENEDNKISIYDIVLIALNLGKTYK